MDDEAQSGSNFSAERLEAFSDGVLAVIITIMAFELRAPVGAGLGDLSRRLPALLVYILSFTMIGIYWNNHHHLLRATPHISGAVMWANLHLLFWLSLIPVMTEWIGGNYRHTWPAVTYGAVGLLAAIAYFVLVRTIIATNQRDSLVVQALGSNTKGAVSVGLYVLAIGLAFVSPWLAYAGYVAIAVAWFVPDRRLTR